MITIMITMITATMKMTMVTAAMITAAMITVTNGKEDDQVERWERIQNLIAGTLVVFESFRANDEPDVILRSQALTFRWRRRRKTNFTFKKKKS